MRLLSHTLMAATGAAGILSFLAPHIGSTRAGVVIGVIAAISASKAPDKLEYLFMGIRWCKHRTITHWPVLWLLLAFSGGYLISRIYEFAMFLVGFGVGGLIHLLGDWMTPKGIPTLFPVKKFFHSLRWCKSGVSEFFIVVTFCIAMSLLCIKHF